MTSSPVLIGVDVGTSSCKVIINSINDKKIWGSKKAVETRSIGTGFFEQDPNEVWETVCKCIKEVFKRSRASPDSVMAIGIAGHVPSPIPVDKNGEPVTPCILHLDERAKECMEEVLRKISPSEIYSTTGKRPAYVYSAMKYLWLKLRKPRVYKKTFKFLEPTSFILHKLTGEFLMDKTQAACTMLFNIRKMGWEQDLINLLELDVSKLPNVRNSIDIAGEVTKEVGKKLGLKGGTQVICGAADDVAATFGAGVNKSRVLSDISGSTTSLEVVTEKIILDKKMRFSCYPYVLPKRWVIDAAFSSGNIINTILELLGVSPQKIGSINQWIDKAIKSTPIGANGMLFSPFMGAGEQSPYWDIYARGTLIGWELKKKVEHILRAVYEGLTYAIKLNVDVFAELGIKLDEARSSGRGAKSFTWSQMKADILNVPVKVPKMLETTSLGAALLAGIGTGVFKNEQKCLSSFVQTGKIFVPDIKKHQRYMKHYSVFKKVYPALEEIFANLCKI